MLRTYEEVSIVAMMYLVYRQNTSSLGPHRVKKVLGEVYVCHGRRDEKEIDKVNMLKKVMV